MLAAREPCEVWPEHWHALQVFLGMGTQWEMHFGWSGVIHIGLRYASLPMVMAAHKRNPHRQPLDLLMLQLQVLERAALSVLNAS